MAATRMRTAENTAHWRCERKIQLKNWESGEAFTRNNTNNRGERREKMREDELRS